ncbi:MAG: HEAT repeat domain-containing protein [Planctomycetota bacterium]|jgi:HEAT repeat protein
MRRVGLWILLFAGVGLAATLKFKNLLDPTYKGFRLQYYTWQEWETLDKKTKLRARGSDPEEWEDPPPDPETEEEKKKREEKEKKEKEGLPGEKKYPKDRWPGFRFDERLTRKMRAFESLVQPASASKLEGIVKQLRLLDKALEKYEKSLDDIRDDYDQLFKQLAKVEEVYRENYKKKYGTVPDTFPVPVSLLVSFNKASRMLQTSVALRQSEVQFHEWLLDRTAELIAELTPEERVKPASALAKGMTDKDWRIRTRSAALLGRLTDQRSVATFDAAMAKEKDPLVLAELIRVRARQGGQGVLDLLKQRLDDPLWPVRAAVVRELARIRTKESVDLLVERMAKEKGRLLDDIADALKKISGESFLPEPDPWRIWWKKARDTWVPPKEGIAAGDEKDSEKAGVVYFYGIRTSSRRVVFCIDVSGSMNFPLDGRNGKKPPRIETAKRELKQALIALPEDAIFNIVIYSGDVKVWKKKMQAATLKNKQAARKYVDRLSPVGATNIFDALVTSMRVATKSGKGKGDGPEADTIFFLTDGKPSHGQIVNPHQILEEITRRNKLMGLVIHTVGVSKEQNAGFLLNLAKRNGGRYVAHK